MFTNCYQSGLYIEIYSQQNKELKKNWKFSGKMLNEYDQIVKTYVTQLITGGASKMLTPKSEKDSLGIVQSYIVFQLYIFSLKSFGIEISISDTSKTKRRIMFSTSSKEVIINPLHCRVPLPHLSMNKWINLSIDVLSFVSECFRSQTFRSIDLISLTGSCKIRKIFTMRNPLPDDTLNNFLYNGKNNDNVYDMKELLPKAMNFPYDVVYENFNVNYERTKLINNEAMMIPNNVVLDNNTNPIVSLNIKNTIGNNVYQLNSNSSGLKPVSMTHHIVNHQIIPSLQGTRQISSVTQPINNNYQSNLNLLDNKPNIEINKRSKSNNKRDIRTNHLKLPEITKNKNPSKILKSSEKNNKKENPSIKLPQIGLKKTNKLDGDKNQQSTIRSGKERLRVEGFKIQVEETIQGNVVNNKNEVGKWENKENEEFEEYERKIGNEIKNEKFEKNNKNINISEYNLFYSRNLSSIHEQDSYDKLDKYYDIPIKKTIDDKGKAKVQLTHSNNTLEEVKEDKKALIQEIFKDNTNNDELRNFEYERQFTPPFSNINTHK